MVNPTRIILGRKFKQTNNLISGLAFKMADLLDGSSSESEKDFKINNDYAERYNKWRGKEELQKLKDRYGDVDLNGGNESSSESEEEDLTNVIDKQFLCTLGYLKSNDPKIYNEKQVFYTEDPQSQENGAKQKSKKKQKAMFISDYKRKVILEKNGVLSDEDDDTMDRPLPLTYHQEQQQLKDSFRTAVDQSDSDEETGGLLTKRSQTKQEKVQEEQDYLRWLKGEIVDTENVDDLGKLKSYWENPKLDSGEAFLRDYILNKRFLDNEDNNDHPTYQQVVDDMSEDETELKRQETFEHKYNFRFEEPDPEFIKSYPRTMENSLRRKDNKRKTKREELKSRKKQEKESRREELNRLKALKRAEILERLESLKEVAGGSMDVFNENDLQDDFDPEEHDKKMKAIFNDDYYGDVEGETQKPEFPPDEELDAENWDNWRGDENNEVENFNMDAECNDDDHTSGNGYNFQNEMVEASRTKKRRRRSRFAQALANKKPVFNPEEKSFEEYLDEYYKLDYEDIIGDQPVRFPYRSVPANDFGLTTEEVLLAKDKELNRWCSLKKTCQYRTDEEEKYDVQAFQKKALNEKVKMKCLSSLYQTDEKDGVVQEDEMENQKKNKRKRKKNNQKVDDNEPDDERLKAFGINPKKHKNKIKYKK